MAEKIKITFLGTGSAIPTERRNHPSFFLEYKEHGILFDCGEGTQRQFRKAKLNPCKITKILISHWHGDHVLGLPGLLQTLILNGYNKKLEIYGPEGTYRMMDAYQQLFIKKGTSFSMDVNEISEEKIKEKDFFIESKKMEHDCPCLAYSFNIPEKTRIDKNKLKKLKIPDGPLISELQKGKTITIDGKKVDGKKIIFTEKGKKVSYITDTLLNKNIQEFLKDSDIIISESTYSEKEKELAEKHKHLTSKQIAEIAKKSNSKKLVLFHLSQRHENPRQILEEAKKIFKETKVAEDFDKFEV
jgi:ribonuclease Z